eukprot:TRINITY_DN61665_c0_g1_i1.p1 TRINITY_DN61665_c0_g1~~TRINITY_DN61665_c0_g1_i1.p1  ORF type:complete len:348 (+),score=27.43 TRINITY_DN61665_c0_g1_i1:133-1044(+)
MVSKSPLMSPSKSPTIRALDDPQSKPKCSRISVAAALQPEPLALPGDDQWLRQTCSWNKVKFPEVVKSNSSAGSSNVGSPTVCPVSPVQTPPVFVLAGGSQSTPPRSAQRRSDPKVKTQRSDRFHVFGRALQWLCPCSPCGSSAVSDDKSNEKVWYRIHPENDMTWYVRRDRGPALKAEVSSSDLNRALPQSKARPLSMTKGESSASVPDFLLRHSGLEDPPGFDRDAFTDDCRICFDRRSEVILLPCKHGCVCEECLRYTVFCHSRSKGGRRCPFCRKIIREVVRIVRDEGVIQYGYAIKAG